MKPELKQPGTKRLKLKYGNPLSSFAVKFNLRRYITAGELLSLSLNVTAGVAIGDAGRGLHSFTFQLNFGAFCGIGGAFGGGLGGV